MFIYNVLNDYKIIYTVNSISGYNIRRVYVAQLVFKLVNKHPVCVSWWSSYLFNRVVHRLQKHVSHHRSDVSAVFSF